MIYIFALEILGEEVSALFVLVLSLLPLIIICHIGYVFEWQLTRSYGQCSNLLFEF